MQLLAGRVTNTPSEPGRVSCITDANVSKVSGALRCGEDVYLSGRGRDVEPLPLIIKEKEQLVLHYRTADGAAEHVPAQLVLGRLLESVLPRVGIQYVVAEVLPQIPVEAIGAGLNRSIYDPALVIAEL